MSVVVPQAIGISLRNNWSHLWISHNGRPNKIRIDRERYMKCTITELDDSNEPVLFTDTIMGNYMADSFFGNFEAETSPIQNSVQLSEVFHFTQVLEEIPVPNTVHLDLNNGLWSLYFDESKSK